MFYNKKEQLMKSIIIALVILGTRGAMPMDFEMFPREWPAMPDMEMNMQMVEREQMPEMYPWQFPAMPDMEMNMQMVEREQMPEMFPWRFPAMPDMEMDHFGFAARGEQDLLLV